MKPIRQQIIVGLLCFMALLCFSIEGYAQKRHPTYQHGLQLLSQNLYRQADDSLSSYIDTHPSDYEAYYYRAYARAQMGRYKDALQDFDKAAKGMQNDGRLGVGYGYLYNAMEDYKKAIACFTDVINRYPKSATEAYTNRGISYQNLGNYRQALADYTSAISTDSTQALAYNNRGTAIYYNQDIAEANRTDLELAVKDFTKALQLSPDLCLAWRNRGLAYILLEKYEPALQDFNKTIACDSKNPWNYMGRGKVELKLNRYNEALADYQKAQTFGKPAEAFMGEAWAYIGLYLPAEAMAAAERSVEADKDFATEAHYVKAKSYAMLNDKKATLRQLKAARKGAYFKTKANRDDFFKSSVFNSFRKDKDFKRFAASL